MSTYNKGVYHKDIHYENLFVLRYDYSLIRKFVNDFKDKWGNKDGSLRTLLRAITERYTDEALELLNKDIWVFAMHEERDFSLDYIDPIFRRNRAKGLFHEGNQCYTYDNYLKEYHRYIFSDYDFTGILKGNVFNIRELDDYLAIIHMLEMPFEELPLYLNSGDGWVTFIANWRLKHGK